MEKTPYCILTNKSRKSNNVSLISLLFTCLGYARPSVQERSSMLGKFWVCLYLWLNNHYVFFKYDAILCIVFINIYEFFAKSGIKDKWWTWLCCKALSNFLILVLREINANNQILKEITSVYKVSDWLST